MADIVLQRDVSSLGSLVRLGAPASATAPAPASTSTGSTIDRLGSFASMPNDMILGVVWGATLATGKTASVQYAMDTSDDGASWTFFVSNIGVVGTGATAASVLSGMFNAGIDLSYARRYIRTNISLVLSATGTDTSIGQAVGMFAGFDRLPQ